MARLYDSHCNRVIEYYKIRLKRIAPGGHSSYDHTYLDVGVKLSCAHLINHLFMNDMVNDQSINYCIQKPSSLSLQFFKYRSFYM